MKLTRNTILTGLLVMLLIMAMTVTSAPMVFATELPDGSSATEGGTSEAAPNVPENTTADPESTTGAPDVTTEVSTDVTTDVTTDATTGSTTEPADPPVTDAPTTGEVTGEITGETTGETTEETSGEVTGETTGETSGEVTGESSGEETEPLSPPPPTLLSIMAELDPASKVYYEGTVFTAAGLTLYGRYDNGTIVPISFTPEELTFSPASPLTSSDEIVTVTYGGKSANVIISVKPIVGFDVVKPTKAFYYYGDAFDPTTGFAGLEITAKYEDGTIRPIALNDPSLKLFYPEKFSNVSTVYATYLGYSIDIGLTIHKVVSITETRPIGVTNYTEGQSVDFSKLLLTARYDDGIERLLFLNGQPQTADLKIKVGDPLTLADKTITFEYYDVSYVIDIVVAPAVKITYIEVSTPPRTNYFRGECFDPTGIVVTLHYEDGTTSEAPFASLSFSPDTTLELTEAVTYVTVTYTLNVNTSYTVDLPIYVSGRQIESTAVLTKPYKLTYTEGEFFDPDGIVIKVYYTDGTSEVLTEPITPRKVFAFSGQKEKQDYVVLSYGGHDITVEITVNPKEASHITVEVPPTKSVYNEGEIFDPAGLVMTLHYKDGTSTTIPDAMFIYSPMGKLEASSVVSVTCHGVTTQLSVEIIPDVVTTEPPITTEPPVSETEPPVSETEPVTTPEPVTTEPPVSSDVTTEAPNITTGVDITVPDVSTEKPSASSGSTTTEAPGSTTTGGSDDGGSNAMLIVWIIIIVVIAASLVALIIYYKRNFM